MQGLVDIVRINPSSIKSLAWLTLSNYNIKSKAPIFIDGCCNGYWHKIEGMACIKSSSPSQSKFNVKT
jgi:hypothetical protein